MWSGGGFAPCTPSGALSLHPVGGSAPCGAAGALPPAPPAGRCPCTPAKRKGAGRPFSLGNLSSGLCDRARRFAWRHAPWGPLVRVRVKLRARPSLHDRALRTTPWEHEAASGPSAAHVCTNDDQSAPLAAPGPSRTCASAEATRLGVCNLWWRVEPVAEDEARRTACQPQPVRARAAPAAHSRRLGAWLPDASTEPPAPSRAAAGSWSWRHGWWRRATIRPDGTSVRLAHAAPALVFGGRLPPPTQVTCAQPGGLTRCTSARGTRRCRWGPRVVLCARSCSAGTRRCPVLPRFRPGCTRAQRRARTQFDTHANEGPPWSVWPGKSSRMVTKAG
jgi:hypothetical protein